MSLESGFQPMPGFVKNYFSGWTVGCGPGVVPLIFGKGRQEVGLLTITSGAKKAEAQNQVFRMLLEMCSYIWMLI